jgi:hypothetical protein
MKITRGVPHPDFKNFGDKIVYNYPLILISKNKITHVKEIVKAL